jgi:hypothetical protein
MGTVDEFMVPIDKHGVPRDRWGRYQLPDPVTGKTRAWTRVTTIAGTLKDRFGLEKWAQRNLVYGLGQAPHLVAKAAAATLDDVKTLEQVADRALEVAGSQSGADVGQALHTFTERIDAGEDVKVPPPYDRDVAAYMSTMRTAGIRVVPGWIERIVCIPELGVAGTVDRLVTGPWGPTPCVGDLKTAADKIYNGRPTNTVVTYGSVDIPLQLALYAHARYWWDNGQWRAMPEVDKTCGIVMHVPAGSGQCRLYEVDLAAGWDAVQMAIAVRDWRKRNDLMATMTPVGPADSGDDFSARLDWLRDRVETIKLAGTKSNGVSAAQRLAALWSDHSHIPTFPKGGPDSHEQIDVIATLCELVETEFELPFGETDPTLPVRTAADRKR